MLARELASLVGLVWSVSQSFGSSPKPRNSRGSLLIGLLKTRCALGEASWGWIGIVCVCVCVCPCLEDGVSGAVVVVIVGELVVVVVVVSIIVVTASSNSSTCFCRCCCCWWWWWCFQYSFSRSCYTDVGCIVLTGPHSTGHCAFQRHRVVHRPRCEA